MGALKINTKPSTPGQDNKILKYMKKLVRPRGFEPLTSAFGGQWYLELTIRPGENVRPLAVWIDNPGKAPRRFCNPLFPET